MPADSQTAAPIDFTKGHRQRLRERLLKVGIDGMQDYEVLEMILFSAHPRGDVKPLAKRLLKQFGSFAGVVHASIPALEKVEGVGQAAISALRITGGAAQLLLREQATSQPVIGSWDVLLDYCRVKMGSLPVEEFHILFLNNKNMLIADEMQQRGTINHTPVYPREVVKRALELNAASLILAHNHPSGDPTPSRADIEMTQQIAAAARPLGIAIHDHLIIGRDGRHHSFKSNGQL